MEKILLVHLGKTRKEFYGTLFFVWIIIAFYSVVYDQWIVTISEEHFTVYHERIFPFENARLIAGAYALSASIFPGLALALASYIVGRVGTCKRIRLKKLLWSVFAVLSLTEVFSILIAVLAYIRGPIYPLEWYPVLDRSLVVTQPLRLLPISVVQYSHP